MRLAWLALLWNWGQLLYWAVNVLLLALLQSSFELRIYYLGLNILRRHYIGLVVG